MQAERLAVARDALLQREVPRLERLHDPLQLRDQLVERARARGRRRSLDRSSQELLVRRCGGLHAGRHGTARDDHLERLADAGLRRVAHERAIRQPRDGVAALEGRGRGERAQRVARGRRARPPRARFGRPARDARGRPARRRAGARRRCPAAGGPGRAPPAPGGCGGRPAGRAARPRRGRAAGRGWPGRSRGPGPPARRRPRGSGRAGRPRSRPGSRPTHGPPRRPPAPASRPRPAPRARR